MGVDMAEAGLLRPPPHHLAQTGVREPASLAEPQPGLLDMVVAAAARR
jgi:hypothetical protein